MGERQITWGENIRAARGARGLTQEALGKALEPPVTQATVARWEGGISTISDDRRIQVSDALGLRPQFLFPVIREAV